MAVEVKPMESKKPQIATGAKESSTPKKTKVKTFISDIKAEIKKITWTSKEELKVYTKIVVGASFVFGIGIYIVDLCIQLTLRALEYAARLITG